MPGKCSSFHTGSVGSDVSLQARLVVWVSSCTGIPEPFAPLGSSAALHSPGLSSIGLHWSMTAPAQATTLKPTPPSTVPPNITSPSASLSSNIVLLDDPCHPLPRNCYTGVWGLPCISAATQPLRDQAPAHSGVCITCNSAVMWEQALKTYPASDLQVAQQKAAHLPLGYANLQLLKVHQICSPDPLPAAALGRAMDTVVWLAAWMVAFPHRAPRSKSKLSCVDKVALGAQLSACAVAFILPVLPHVCTTPGSITPSSNPITSSLTHCHIPRITTHHTVYAGLPRGEVGMQPA